MINHRVLNLSERRQFRRHYESFGIGTISDDYLKNTIVRGFFDQNLSALKRKVISIRWS